MLLHRTAGLVACFLLATAPGNPVAAQQAPESRHLRLVEQRLQAIRHGTQTRVALVGGAEHRGDFGGLEDGLAVLRNAQTTRVPLGDIDGVWTRGRAIVPGAIVGGVAGIAVGVFYGLVAAELDEVDDPSPFVAAVTGGLVVGAAGAGAGAIVGAAIPIWKRRYP